MLFRSIVPTWIKVSGQDPILVVTTVDWNVLWFQLFHATLGNTFLWSMASLVGVVVALVGEHEYLLLEGRGHGDDALHVNVLLQVDQFLLGAGLVIGKAEGLAEGRNIS